MLRRLVARWFSHGAGLKRFAKRDRARFATLFHTRLWHETHRRCAPITGPASRVPPRPAARAQSTGDTPEPRSPFRPGPIKRVRAPTIAARVARRFRQAQMLLWRAQTPRPTRPNSSQPAFLTRHPLRLLARQARFHSDDKTANQARSACRSSGRKEKGKKS